MRADNYLEDVAQQLERDANLTMQSGVSAWITKLSLIAGVSLALIAVIIAFWASGETVAAGSAIIGFSTTSVILICIELHISEKHAFDLANRIQSLAQKIKSMVDKTGTLHQKDIDQTWSGPYKNYVDPLEFLAIFSLVSAISLFIKFIVDVYV